MASPNTNDTPHPTDDLPGAFQAAVAAHQSGDVEAAIAGYKAILAVNQGHSGARINLAAALRGAGRLDEALAQYRVALEADEGIPELWFNAGNMMRELAMPAEAEAAYRRAIALRHDMPGAHFHLADILHASERRDEALAEWRTVLELKPDHALAWRRVVHALEASGRKEEAEKALAEAVARVPSEAWLLRRLADYRFADGDLDEAEGLYRRAIGVDPAAIEAHNGLGVILASRGDLDGSLACFEWAEAIDAEHAPTQANLATLNTRRNRMDLAIPQYRRALAIDQDMEEAVTGLVKSLARVGACGEAVTVAAAAAARRPDSAEIGQALGFALTHQGRIGEALDTFAAARRSDPEHVLAHLNAAFTSLYSDAMTAEEVTELHRDLIGAVERRQPQGIAPVPADRDPARRLKIGYLGPDFRGHPVGYFIESALVHHDRDAFELFCYADVVRPDAVTERMQQLGHTWRDVYGWDVERLEAQIRADGIDVLVELGGHSAGQCVGLLPRRPAPIQALYLGYPCTSGVAAVDYVISDAIVSPPELARLYTEKVMALDGCFLCFRPYPDAPPVAPLPALVNGCVTFGCYNNLPKLSPSAIALWARVLHAVPDSWLALKAPGLGDPPTRQLFWRQLEAHGIARDRVWLDGITSPLSAFLAEYGRIDIALDSLPYGGGTTTCEALWMGVPVVSLAGRHFYSRMGASILTQAGLPNLVADSPDDFVRIAADLAADVDGLARLRAGLREQVRASAVCDGPRYARALEAAYRAMWTEYVAGINDEQATINNA